MPSAPPKAAEQAVRSGPIHVDRLDSAGWVRCGLSPRQAAAAMRYRDAAGGFTHRSVLARMRVLPDGWLERHEADLVFPNSRQPDREEATDAGPPTTVAHAAGVVTRSNWPVKAAAMPVDLNRADSLELLAMRGIGPWVAGRILTARRRWGGFHSTDQLGMALGWDSLATALAPKFHCRAEDVQRRCPDTLDAAGWSALPGIRWAAGEMLERTVRHHGASVATLRQSGALDSAEWAGIWPYLDSTACKTGNPSRN